MEYLFRSGKLEGKYKPARFHVLLAARILTDPSPVPPMNSREMERYCKQFTEALWDTTKVDELFSKAIAAVEDAAGGDFHRDNIRTDLFTQKVVASCLNGGGISETETA